MTPKHHQYSNPTISEAVCEIHFTLAEGQTWQPSIFGEYLKLIGDNYPNMEPQIESGFEIRPSPQGLMQRALPPRQKILYRNKTNTALVQLKEGMVAFNVLPPYQSWDSMLENILDAWNKTLQLIAINDVVKTGLRFINRIERESDSQKASEWLKAGEYISSATLKSEGDFLSRAECRPDKDSLLTVTVGIDRAVGKFGSIIFDIDRITETILAPKVDTLKAHIDTLHEQVWSVFDAAKTEKLEALLNKKP